MSWLAARPLALALALALDLLLGDPRYRLHPVRLLGDAIAVGERTLRRSGLPERLGGAVLAVGTTVLTVVIALAVSIAAWRIGGPLVGLATDAVLVYFALAGRALADEGRAIGVLLADDDLPAARTALAGIVGRDTENLDECQIARAAIETIAENSVDALIAPAFWALLLGPGGAWLHKAASTLDSMVGYRNQRYAHFGTAGARLDDALAWVPARLAIPLIALGAAVSHSNPRDAWTTGLRDRLKHASPNSAHGEAAFAGALHVRLGGIVTYGGAETSRPEIGAEFPPPRRADLSSAVRLLLATEVLMLVASAVLTVGALAELTR